MISAAVLIPLLLEILKATPELVQDVENLVAAFKGKGSASGQLAPEVIADLAAGYAAFKAAKK